MGDPVDCPKCGKREKKEVLSMLKEMWLKGDSPLHRIYSSWEELEANVKITSETTRSKGKRAIQPCPNCGTKQNIAKPMEGIFPYQNCKSCKHPFYVNKDLTVRKLTADESRDIPRSWFQIVEDLSKNRVAVIFRLE
jgi:hypothetical protein